MPMADRQEVHAQEAGEQRGEHEQALVVVAEQGGARDLQLGVDVAVVVEHARQREAEAGGQLGRRQEAAPAREVGVTPAVGREHGEHRQHDPRSVAVVRLLLRRERAAAETDPGHGHPSLRRT